MKVAVIRYNGGNTGSVANAFERLGVECVITDSAEEILGAERVVFPGVGEASSAMRYLEARGLDTTIRSLRAPMLAICLGLQLLCDSSEEGSADCLGIIPGAVRRFVVPRKVPHMGWSQVTDLAHPVFKGIAPGSYFYFVHSYRLGVSPCGVATCEYGEPFTAAAAKDNYIGVQFHPEKSGVNGELLLKNFLEWKL